MSVGGAIFISFLTVLATGGLFLVCFGWFGQWAEKTPVDSVGPGVLAVAPQKKSFDSVDLLKRCAVALAAAIVAYLISSWLVLALFAFVGGFAWFSVRANAKEKARQLNQILALATWVEGLKDTMAASAGISEALAISADIAPGAIKVEVRNLVIRMERQPTAVALQQFAADIANPAADMIVASFSLALTKQAGSLNEILAAISQNARDTANMLREIEAGRSEVRTQSKLTVGVISAVCLFMILTQRESLNQYDTAIGQIALFCILSLFALSGFMLYQLSKSDPVRRVFARVAVDTGEPAGVKAS